MTPHKHALPPFAEEEALLQEASRAAFRIANGADRAGSGAPGLRATGMRRTGEESDGRFSSRRPTLGQVLSGADGGPEPVAAYRADPAADRPAAPVNTPKQTPPPSPTGSHTVKNKPGLEALRSILSAAQALQREQKNRSSGTGATTTGIDGTQPEAPVAPPATKAASDAPPRRPEADRPAERPHRADMAPAQTDAASSPTDAADENTRLGELLIAGGLISRNQLRIGMIEQRRTKGDLGPILIDLGFLTEQALAEVRAHNSGREYFDPDTTLPDPRAIATLPENVARRLAVFPVGYEGGVLSLAMVDPGDEQAMTEARLAFGPDTRIEPLSAGSEKDIAQAIDRFYGHTLTVDGVLKDLEALGESGTDIRHAADRQGHPVVRLVDALLLDAVKRRASDIHFEPDGAFLRVRLRLDGVLVQTLTFHKRYWRSAAQRIKLLAGFPTSGEGALRDRRFSMTVAHRRVDFRVSILPTVHGENIVLRILDRAATPLSLDQLNFAPDTLSALRRLSLRPEGMLLVVGPAGAGKTTTLYALMDHISTPELSIVTVEDQVEYDMPLLRQTQVDDTEDLSFPAAIRALLRQDPDVILIGEIRDRETALMAMKAARTGHRVQAAMHANDTLGALSHLIDLGLSPGMLSGTLAGILSQRLTRRLCPSCRQAEYAREDECRLLGLDPERPPALWRAVGCGQCDHLGYRGRVPITELLTITPEMDALLTENAPLARLRVIARKQTTRTMLADGLRLLFSGTIDLPSLMRAVDVTRRQG